MPEIAKKPRMTNDERHMLLNFLIINNAIQFGRGDSQAAIAKEATRVLNFKVKRTAVQSNLAFLHSIVAIPFKLRKRRPIRGAHELTSKSWDKLDVMIRSDISGRVKAEIWSIRTVQRYAWTLLKVKVGLDPLKAHLLSRGYNCAVSTPDEPITIVHGSPK